MESATNAVGELRAEAMSIWEELDLESEALAKRASAKDLYSGQIVVGTLNCLALGVFVAVELGLNCDSIERYLLSIVRCCVYVDWSS